MNLAVQSPLWLLSILFLLLTAAAVEDGWRMRISNAFPIAIMITAVVSAVVAGASLALWQNVALFAALLTIGTILFGAGLLGGGDVKLLAACGLWFDFFDGWRMLVAVAIAGGLLAILLLSARPLLKADGRIALLKRKGGIPYGIAVAAGTAIAIGAMR